MCAYAQGKRGHMFDHHTASMVPHLKIFSRELSSYGLNGVRDGFFKRTGIILPFKGKVDNGNIRVVLAK
jgi:hypothetical protein